MVIRFTRDIRVIIINIYIYIHTHTTNCNKLNIVNVRFLTTLRPPAGPKRFMAFPPGVNKIFTALEAKTFNKKFKILFLDIKKLNNIMNRSTPKSVPRENRKQNKNRERERERESLLYHIVYH